MAALEEKISLAVEDDQQQQQEDDYYSNHNQDNHQQPSYGDDIGVFEALNAQRSPKQDRNNSKRM